jgi:hypothetical protein
VGIGRGAEELPQRLLTEALAVSGAKIKRMRIGALWERGREGLSQDHLYSAPLVEFIKEKGADHPWLIAFTLGGELKVSHIS